MGHRTLGKGQALSLSAKVSWLRVASLTMAAAALAFCFALTLLLCLLRSPLHLSTWCTRACWQPAAVTCGASKSSGRGGWLSCWSPGPPRLRTGMWHALGRTNPTRLGLGL